MDGKVWCAHDSTTSCLCCRLADDTFHNESPTTHNAPFVSQSALRAVPVQRIIHHHLSTAHAIALWVDGMRNVHLTLAVLGAQKWAKRLHNPYCLEGPQCSTRGQNQKWLPNPASPEAHVCAKWPHNICCLGGPLDGDNSTPAIFEGSHAGELAT